MKNIEAKELQLGKKSEYAVNYDKSLLFQIARASAREKINISPDNFSGFDIWNCYELSWLDSDGKPLTAVARVIYPCSSKYLVESKSLKLYFNSFNMTKFDSCLEVQKRIENDLRQTLECVELKVSLFNHADKIFKYINFENKNVVDSLNIDVNEYSPNSDLLSFSKENKEIEYELFSHLLKSNCPVTGQPDWGTVHVKYFGKNRLSDESFLKYIASYRNAQDFHELCCEKIFCDLVNCIQPKKLYVKCYYTRRGGIDINPVRVIGYNIENSDFLLKTWRQ